MIRLDVKGIVRYASPNALSAIHRLGHIGDVIGELLAKVVADLSARRGHVDESLAVVVTGRAPWRTEVETRGATSRCAPSRSPAGGAHRGDAARA